MLAALLALAGCAGTSEQPLASAQSPLLQLRSDADFLPRPDIASTGDVLALTPEQRADFDAWFNHPSRANVPGHRRLVMYLESRTRGFTFRGDTFTASQAMARNSGNCLSLAILTTALAQRAGVEVDYQLMEDDPVFEFQGSVVEKGVHVRTLLYDPDWEEAKYPYIFTRPGLVVDYIPTHRSHFLPNLSLEGFLARYYHNIAAEELAMNDLHGAYWNSVAALDLAPDDAGAINSLAVVYRRAGLDDLAEQVYLDGIARAGDKLTLLKNYQLLLLAQERHAEAAVIEARLADMDDPSPYHWYRLASEAYAAGDYDEAIRYYRRAARLAPYLPEIHAGLGKAYYLSGDRGRAKDAFREAVEQAYESDDRGLYEAKLAALTGH
ncbi:tetratricopeptide repeat protein [Mangrovimicrobium sediminis]|uniref:tetratricopeptide repeat protein n=1 Tax=Mangrovimicrobium sediminis TaxID=2562682 RepID=UPI001436BCDD|nr:tetratricopeptide repeat protein [Haliea sp. SAOS-164]